jgi:hypothetical protein
MMNLGMGRLRDGGMVRIIVPVQAIRFDMAALSAGDLDGLRVGTVPNTTAPP